LEHTANVIIFYKNELVASFLPQNFWDNVRKFRYNYAILNDIKERNGRCLQVKKVRLLVLLLCLILFVACNGGDERNLEATEIVNTETATEENNTGVTEIDDPITVADLPDYVPYIITRGSIAWFSEYVAIIDLLTGDEMATLMLECEADIVLEVFNFDNGYFGALVGVNNPVHLYFTGDAPNDFDLEAALAVDHDYRLRYLILDQELNILQDLPVTSDALNDENTHAFGTLAVYEDGELIVYYSPNYLFNTRETASIYRYHVNTNTEEFLVELGHKITLHELFLIEPYLMAFTGGRIAGADESAGVLGYYGVVNLATGQLDFINESGFRHSEIMSNGTQILVSEGLNVHVNDDDNMYLTTDRNELLLINATTMEHGFVQLNELESAQIQLVADSYFFVTVSSDRSTFNKYEIIDGTSIELVQSVALVKSTEPDRPRELSLSEGGGRPVIFQITDNMFVIHYLEGESSGGRVVELIVLPTMNERR